MKYTLTEIRKSFAYWVSYSLNQNELEFKELFLKALDTNDIKNIEPYFQYLSEESSTFSMNQLYLNYSSYHKGLNFGFTEIKFDEYNWLKNVEWIKTDEIVFKERKGYLQNKVCLAQGKNGKWCYSLYYGSAFDGGGGGSAPNVYCVAYDSYEEVLIKGIKDLLERLSKIKESKALDEIKVQAQHKLSELTKINEYNQLSMF